MKNLTLLLFFLYGNALMAQPSEGIYKARCSELDKTKIKTDFLADYRNPINNIYLLNGDINDTISLYSFKQLYYDLKKSELVLGTLPEMDSFRKSMLGTGDLFTIPLGLIHKKYTRIHQHAVQNGHLDLVDGKFIETGAPADSIYLEGFAFAIAPLRHGNYLPVGSPLKFLLPQDLIFANNTNDFVSYEIDFGQGNGYQYFQPNEEISVSFNSDGEKLFRFRLITTTDTLYSHATLDLVTIHQADNATTLSATGGDGLICPPDAAMEFFTGDYSECGLTAGSTSARAYIRYADAENPVLTNPILFIEGLDLGDEDISIRVSSQIDPNRRVPIRYGKFGWDVFTTGIVPDFPEDLTFQKLPELLNAFNEDGYDIILLDFEQGATFIQQNSDLLKQLIDWVNNEKVSCEELVVIGASMGGAIARYTLATMEQAGEEHQTRLYTSFDAPHQGVNIPISVQELMDNLSNNGDVQAQEGLDDLALPGPRQLVIGHYDNEYCLRESFVAEMEAVGYPEQCRKVSIVSGSDRGPNAPQSSANPGDKLLELRVDVTVTPLLGHYNLNLDLFALERKSFAGPQVVYEQDADFFSINPFFWAIGNTEVSDANHTASAIPANFGALDSAPGGTRTTISRTLVPSIQDQTSILESNLLPLAGVIADVDLFFEAFHTFTPSISALDVDTDDLFFRVEDIDKDNPDPSLIPFDAYYSQPQNLGHVEVSDGIINWVRNIELPKSRVNLANTLNETYNYGFIINKIPEVTIDQEAKILQSRVREISGTIQSNNGMDNSALKVERQEALVSLQNINDAYFAVGSSLAAETQEKAFSLIGENDNLSQHRIYESNEKIVHDIYLQILAENRFLTNDEKSTLETIAKQCPLTGGNAVFQARIMIGQPFLEDEELCQSAALKESEEPVINISKQTTRISPNPANDKVVVYTEEDVTDIAIIDFMGNKIQRIPLIQGENKTISLAGFKNGIYFFTLMYRNHPIRTEKITILKDY